MTENLRLRHFQQKSMKILYVGYGKAILQKILRFYIINRNVRGGDRIAKDDRA